ncbi:MAG: hypothetical protein EON52_12450 [Actinomycetales bacterium]|nr:MAG: hypothetical protein EON52_12450 [Actinomycetales bacterium]
MSESFAVSDIPGSGADRPVEERGTLDVRAKAVENILRNAALAVPGSVPHTGGVGPLSTKSLPSASVTFRGSIATATLDVAAHWPCRAEELAASVRDTVRTEASRLSGTDITRVDVTLHVVPGSNPTTRPRRVL